MAISCISCCKDDLNKDTIGINKKLLGENINNFYPIMILVITSLVGVISITFIRRRKRG